MTEREDECRPVPGYEGIYEISRDGRLFAVERLVVQVDIRGRTFYKKIKRRQKSMSRSGNGYASFNLSKDGRQTCRLLSTLLRDAWPELEGGSIEQSAVGDAGP